VARRELVEVERDRVRRQQEQLEFVRQQVEVGRANRSDLLRSRVDLNNAQLDLINARNNARAATFALAREMGVREQVAPVAGASLAVDSLPYGRAEIMRMAVRTGPRVKAARQAAEAAESRVGTARSAYLPNLTFQGGWAWQNDAFPPEDRSWSLSLRGSYPLFNGFQRETGVARARAQADAAWASERESILTLRADVDDAYSQVESARASLELARRTVELSREDLRVTRERFRLGLATILDLQSAQITLKQAEADLVQRRFDYQIGVARLESLVGQELETVPRPGDGSPDAGDAGGAGDAGDGGGAAPDGSALGAGG
jgi:outer membrane protein TolC